MPLKSIDYSKTCFYKIVSKDVNIKEIYVGHTTDFTRRRRGHKTVCSNPNAKNYNMNVYRFIREHGGWECFDMILLEQRPCLDALDAKRIERDYIEQLSASLNNSIPSRTREEWVEDNKDHLQEYKHQWHIENNDAIKSKKKEYYQDKKDEIKEKTKAYYNNNRDAAREFYNEKKVCCCGGTYTVANKARHERSSKHQQCIQNK